MYFYYEIVLKESDTDDSKLKDEFKTSLKVLKLY